MAVSVLGPFDTGSEPLSPRERAVLSALIVRKGRAVAPGVLAEACWGEARPSTWSQQVRNAVARIRTRLGRSAVQTVGSDYQLGLDPDVIDAVRFERTVDSARQHVLHGEWDRAVDAYRRALALWRGDAFPDLTDWEPAAAEAARLAEVRATAEEELLESRLQGREVRAVIPEAERLVREQPLREERWAILARANYLSGRQAEALAVVRTARQRLLEELGIDPGPRLGELELAILRQDPSLQPSHLLPIVSPDCPYRGLDAFGLDDSATFFGRDADIEAVLERALPGAVVAIAGPSGSGKSSLLLAGVLPRLAGRGRSSRVLRPGDAHVSAILEATYGPEPVDVVAIDQAEELLRATEAEIESFCRAVHGFLGEGTVLLTLRSDFLDVARALPHVGHAVGRGIYLLGPLQGDSLREAIERPAGDAGLRFEPGLLELVLRDTAGHAAVLPHLSHALRETWARREGATLTVAGYQAAGGIAGAIATSAEQAFLSLSPSEQDACRSLMSRLVVHDESGVWVRRRVQLASLRDDPIRRRVVQAMTGARLLSVDDTAIALAHEAVTEAWPRLAGWLAEDAEGTRLLAVVAAASEAWHADGRSEDDLLRGARLQAVLEWRDRARPDLTTVEAEFLDASAGRADRDLRAVSERAARDRRQNTRLRWALSGVAALLAISLSTGGLAAVRGVQAAASGQDAAIEALVSTSMALRGSRRDVAALLAVEAHRRWPDDARSRAALMATMTAAGGLTATRYFPGAEIVDGAPIPGTSHAVLVPTPGTPGVYDVVSGDLVTPLDLMGGPYEDDSRPLIGVSHDGGTAAIAQRRGSGTVVTVLDLSSGNVLRSYHGGASDDGAVAVSLDGSRVAGIANSDALLTVIDARVEGAERVVRFPRAARNVRLRPWMTAVGFAAGGEVVVGTSGTSVSVFDPDTLELRHSIAVPADSANTAVVGLPDGRVVAAGHSGIVALDPVRGTVLWQAAFAEPREMSCAWLTVSTARGTAYCGNHTGVIVEHSLEDGGATGRRWEPQIGRVGPLGVSPDGSTLFSFGIEAPTISVWRLDGGGAASDLVAAGQVAADGYDSSGKYLITAEPLGPGAIGTPRVWDVAMRRSAQELAGLERGLPSYQFSGLFSLAQLAENRWPVAWAGPGRVTGVRGVTPVLIELADGASWPVPARPEGDTRVWPVRDGAILYAEVEWTGARPVGPTETDATLPRLSFSPTAWVSAPPSGELVAVTAWLTTEASLTEIADPLTGEVIASGLEGAIATAFTAADEITAAWPTGRIARFDARTLEPRGVISGSPGAVTALWASRDGRTLLATSLDGTVSVYDVASGRRLGDPIASNMPGEAPGFLRPDGGAFAVNTRQGVVAWSLDPTEHAEAACRIAGRNLTEEEWSSHLGHLGEYRETCG